MLGFDLVDRLDRSDRTLECRGEARRDRSCCEALHTPLSARLRLFCKGFLVRYEQMFGFMDEIKLDREALDAQTAAWLEKVAAFDRSEEWRAAGFYSAAAALADVCRMDKGVASATVKLARKLEKLPLVAEAFAAGEISERHASVIATAATRGADGGVLEPGAGVRGSGAQVSAQGSGDRRADRDRRARW